MNEIKKHIYFMPGLAASSSIFEYIQLPKDKYELHFLEWLLPETPKETITHYCKRLTLLIKHKNPILIGVSFGGMIVQEIAKQITVEKTIIISSIKNISERPKRLHLLQKTKLYKLFPSNKISKIKDFTQFDFNNSFKKKLVLYNKYLAVRDAQYLNWAVHHVLHWKPNMNNDKIIHIHGSKDKVFPIKHIKNSIIVENGTHAMIVVKAKKISKILLSILD